MATIRSRGEHRRFGSDLNYRTSRRGGHLGAGNDLSEGGAAGRLDFLHLECDSGGVVW